MLKNIREDSRGSIPPLCMPSLLPHDLCHGRSASRWLPAVIEFQLSYSRSSLNMQYAGSRQLWAHLSPPKPSDLLLPLMYQPPIPLQAGFLVKPEWQENNFSATLQQFPAHLSSLQLSSPPLSHLDSTAPVCPISMGLNGHLCLLWWRGWPGSRHTQTCSTC